MDANGETLDASKHNYTITFPAGQFPPVNAFWSVTLYDGKSQLLVKNPLNRYLINSPMLPDMKTNDDGSLTFTSRKIRRVRTRKATGCLRRTTRFIWSCAFTGRRPKPRPFCRRAKALGNRRASCRRIDLPMDWRGLVRAGLATGRLGSFSLKSRTRHPNDPIYGTSAKDHRLGRK